VSSAPDATPGRIFVAGFGVLATVSVCHTLLFWGAWTLTDVYVKVQGYFNARQGIKDFTMDAKEVLRETMREEMTQARQSGDDEDALLLESALEFHAAESMRLASPKPPRRGALSPTG